VDYAAGANCGKVVRALWTDGTRANASGLPCRIRLVAT
jgi:hypothetical protein